MKDMEKVTIESSPLNVEDVYVGTLVKIYLKIKLLVQLLNKKYPKIFTPSCCIHIVDSTMEDMCKILEMKAVIDACRFIAVF